MLVEYKSGCVTMTADSQGRKVKEVAPNRAGKSHAKPMRHTATPVHSKFLTSSQTFILMCQNGVRWDRMLYRS